MMAVDDVDAGRREALTSSERKELLQLRRQTRVQAMEIESLKPASAYLARELAPKQLTPVVGDLADGVPVAVTCRVLGTSRSEFYDAASRSSSPLVVSDTALTIRIEQIHAVSRRSGAPRVHAELHLGQGVRVGRTRVARHEHGRPGWDQPPPQARAGTARSRHHTCTSSGASSSPTARTGCGPAPSPSTRPGGSTAAQSSTPTPRWSWAGRSPTASAPNSSPTPAPATSAEQAVPIVQRVQRVQRVPWLVASGETDAFAEAAIAAAWRASQRPCRGGGPTTRFEDAGLTDHPTPRGLTVEV